jgi:hypothetical protein
VDVQIAVDLGLILRCSAALLWGVLWACAIQFSRLGKFLASERTWIVVVIGIGVDLLLGIGADWWVFWLIVPFSSLGIIARSLMNEHEYKPDVNSYRNKWSLEDAIDHIGNVMTYLEQALEADGMDESHANVSRALSQVHHAQRIIEVARYGQPEKKK